MNAGAQRLRRDIGQRVRELRKDRGLSQEKLAELAGVHRTFVGKIERGESAITVDSIAVLCYALDTTLAEFFGAFSKPLQIRGPRRQRGV